MIGHLLPSRCPVGAEDSLSALYTHEVAEHLALDHLAAAGELRDRGYGVVLAHPERADGLWRDDAAGLPVLPEASWVQVTAASLTGRSGAVVQARAERLARSSSSPRTPTIRRHGRRISRVRATPC